MRQFPSNRLRSAYCLVHQKMCSIDDELAHVHKAGTSCQAHSSMGNLDREQAIQFAHFLIWLAIRKRLQEMILVQENVVGFPRDTFIRFLPEYEFEAAIVAPDSYGWPIARERQWIVFLEITF